MDRAGDERAPVHVPRRCADAAIEGQRAVDVDPGGVADRVGRLGVVGDEQDQAAGHRRLVGDEPGEALVVHGSSVGGASAPPSPGVVTIHPDHPFQSPPEQRDPVRRWRGRLGGTVSLWTSGVGTGPTGRAGLTSRPCRSWPETRAT